MAKITRKTQKILGATAGTNGITEYGSVVTGTPVAATDLDDIQTSRWLDGWSAATLAGTEIPTFQDRNAVDYVATTQISYILQEGVPEYDAGTEYHQYSIVKKAGTYEIYGSKTNANEGNALPSQADNTDWQYLGSLADIGGGGSNIGDVNYTAATSVPSNGLLCDGSSLSTTTYAELFAVIGYTHGGSGANFNVPDLVTNNRFIRASGGSLSVGDTQTDAFGSHSHTVSGTGGQNVTGTNSVKLQSPEGTAGSVSTSSAGGAETRPHNIALLPYIIFE